MFGIPLRLIGYGAGLIAILGLLAGIHHHGVTSGKAARDAYWQPLFAAAEKAAAEANAKTDAVISKQTAISAESEARHADEITAVNTRAADADRRIRVLLRDLASRPGRCEVSAVPESSGEPDVPSPGDERAFRIGDAVTDVARRCELDAANLAALQDWIRAQQALNGTR